MGKGEEIGGFTVGRQANAGVSGGQDIIINNNTCEIDVHKVGKKVSESIECFPSLVGVTFVRPLKPPESASERGRDRDENIERCAVDVDAVSAPPDPYLPHAQLPKMLERSEVGKRKLDV